MPVRAIEELKPIEILTTPKGEVVLDLGQNMVGWVRMKVKGKKGDKIIQIPKYIQLACEGFDLKNKIKKLINAKGDSI